MNCPFGTSDIKNLLLQKIILEYGTRVEWQAAIAEVDENENAKRRKLFEGKKPGR
jgi:hypothetical protein